jgi:hypothetical protein
MGFDSVAIILPELKLNKVCSQVVYKPCPTIWVICTT